MAKVLDDGTRISENFHNRFLDLVEEKEITLDELSKQSKVNKSTISLANKYSIVPSLRSLIKLADYFDVSLDYLLGKTNENDFIKSENPTTFHVRLKELSQERKVKYSKIALAIHLTRNYFYEWCSKGTLPCLDYLEMIAEYFNVSTDYLLGRTDYRD